MCVSFDTGILEYLSIFFNLSRRANFLGKGGKAWPLLIATWLFVRPNRTAFSICRRLSVCYIIIFPAPPGTPPFFSKGRVPAGQFSRYFQRKGKEGVDSINCYLANRLSQPQARQFSVCRRWLACLLHFYFPALPSSFFSKRKGTGWPFSPILSKGKEGRRGLY